jgi:sugar lactone lactonase YvrE
LTFCLPESSPPESEINPNKMSSMRLPRTAAPSLPVLGIALAAALLPLPVARAQSNYATPYTFTTLAGSPYAVGIVDGTGAAARFFYPDGVAVDTSGNVYVADEAGNTIRKVTPDGVVTTLAGTFAVTGSQDGTGSAAQFNQPAGLAVDGSGNVYVSDQGNDTIRKITPAGVVTTLAGTAKMSGSADGTGPAARFATPGNVAVDSSGNVYVADQLNDTIRKITPGGVVTTFAGDATVAGHVDGTGAGARFDNPYGIAVDSSGNVYVADTYNCTIRKITSAGVSTTIAGTPGIIGAKDGTGAAAQFNYPTGVAVDGSGNVYVADVLNYTIRMVTPSGVVTTIAGDAGLTGFSDGAGTLAEFNYPYDIAVDGSDNLYVADLYNFTLRKITPPNVVTTLAGLPGEGYADGTGSAAQFYYPTGMVLDAGGNLYVVDNSNCTIRRVTPSGAVTTVAGTPGRTGYADGTGAAAEFNYPYGIAMDKSGNMYVSDESGETVRKVTPSGVVTTLAGTPGVSGSANGTGSAALFNSPAGIVVDGSGNIYVSEQKNCDIRKISPSGAVTTLAGTAGSSGNLDGTGAAAQFQSPAGLALDGSGDLYVADYGNGTIRKVTPAGVVTTVAGKPGSEGSADGTGASAQFDAPEGVAVDGGGNLYVTDQKNNTIRMITPAGVVTTLAGTAGAGNFANGTGGGALFSQPFGIVVDGSGNLYVSDAGNDLIRKGSASGVPQIQTQPTDQYTAVGGSATFSVTASGSGTLTYQWAFNGAPIAGATGPTYTVTNAQASNGGPYTVTITNSYGAVTSSAGTLYVNTGASGARLINLSCRAGVGTGANILIVGFVSGGSGTTGSQPVLVRGTGPALAAFGVGGTLPDPSLTLYQGSTVVSENSGWGSNAAQITAEDTAVGAFALTNTSSKDSALYIPNLAPNGYTAQIAGASGDTGVALAEVYDATPPAGYSATAPRLINLSARDQVGTGGNILIAGFVIGGTGSETVLVRASGPALVPFGVTGTLPDPKLQLYRSNADGTSTLLGTNAGWGGDSTIAAAAGSVGAFSWGTAATADSALLVTLPPGDYTAQVSGAAGDTGVALIEVYEVP